MEDTLLALLVPYQGVQQGAHTLGTQQPLEHGVGYLLTSDVLREFLECHREDLALNLGQFRTVWALGHEVLDLPGIQRHVFAHGLLEVLDDEHGVRGDLDQVIREIHGVIVGTVWTEGVTELGGELGREELDGLAIDHNLSAGLLDHLPDRGEHPVRLPIPPDNRREQGELERGRLDAELEPLDVGLDHISIERRTHLLGEGIGKGIGMDNRTISQLVVVTQLEAIHDQHFDRLAVGGATRPLLAGTLHDLVEQAVGYVLPLGVGHEIPVDVGHHGHLT